MQDEPEEAEKSEPTGILCFKDGNRECGPDCIEFLTTAPQGDPEYVAAPMWMRCHLLVNEHRKGKHLVIIASQLGKILAALDPTKNPGLPPPPVTR